MKKVGAGYLPPPPFVFILRIQIFSVRQYGEVWQAKVHGTDVAVKKLFIGGLPENVREDFLREARIMMYVSIYLIFISILILQLLI